MHSSQLPTNGMYVVCRAPCDANSGWRLYEVYKRELDRCVVTLKNEVLSHGLHMVGWIGSFDAAWGWFASGVVSVLSLSRGRMQCFLMTIMMRVSEHPAAAARVS